MLNEQQRRQLLTLARNAIARVLGGHAPDVQDHEFDDALRTPSGAFVTLTTHDDELRGCIGSIEPRAPLLQAVASSAVNAAFRDPRFYPIRPGELETLKIEISVMGPIEQVSSVEEITV